MAGTSAQFVWERADAQRRSSPQISQRLQDDYQFKPTQDGKHLRKGTCPGCGKRSLCTYAASPWVVRCERLNNCGYEAHELHTRTRAGANCTRVIEEAKPPELRNPNAGRRVPDALARL